MEYNQQIACPCCGAIVKNTKYCTECGNPLRGANNVSSDIPFPDDKKPGVLSVFFDPFPTQPKSCKAARSDKGLTLLVNTCKKTIATVGGNGYTEIVLYVDEITGKYWLHTYEKYENMQTESHSSYTAHPKLAQEVFDYIEKHNLVSWRNKRGFGLCGANYIIKFRHNNQIIRLDSSNMPDNFEAYSTISSMLYAAATENNKCYDES